jgi:hypothetical protein
MRGVRYVLPEQPCSSPGVAYRAYLTTPWANVVEVREKRTDWAMVPGSFEEGQLVAGVWAVLVAGVAGVGVALLKPSVGVPLLGAGVLVDLPLVYWAFRSPPQSRVVYRQSP